MSNKRVQQRVSTTSGTGSTVCEWFIAYGHTEVHCKGICDGCRTIVRFNSRKGLDTQKKIFCETFNYPKCEVARMLDAIREDDE